MTASSPPDGSSSSASGAPASPPRRPRVFSADDPGLLKEPEIASPVAEDEEPSAGEIRVRPTAEELQRGVRWGALFVSALVGLAAISLSLTFARFVAAALERQDWIGWIAFGLLALAGLAAAVMLLRELFGIFRLRRLTRLRADIAGALASQDVARERSAVAALQRLFSTRADLRWGLARIREHVRDVRDPGDLLRLADREVMAPIDLEARRRILKSAKRVATVTALSPMPWIAMIYVLVENLRTMRGLATIYGGRPGLAGTLKLARMTFTHILATGGVAMTDDLLGQFLGQDVLRRLSRRLGEGAFNGALTARIGVAAIHVTRPLPFLDAPEIRVRDIVRELFRREAGERGDR